MKSDRGGSPRVSIIIPSIGHQPLLSKLIKDLFDGTRTEFEIIVSHSGEMCPVDLGQGVTLVHQDPPLLVSAARNRGAEKAKGEYLFFVDDDNEVASGAVDVLAELLDKDPNMVEVGPAMYYATDRERAWCLGVSHRGKLSRTNFILDAPSNGSRSIISEALPNSFMVRRIQFESIGGFDEVSFPMDFEESDLAFRLRREYGGYLACSLDAKIWHDVPLLLKQKLIAKTLPRSYNQARNRPIFIARHIGLRQWLSYLLIGQFLLAPVRIWAILFGDNNTGYSRARICSTYIAGMAAGTFLSIREIDLRRGRARLLKVRLTSNL